MIDFQLREDKVIEWADANGLNPNVDTLRDFLNNECNEFHDAKGIDKMIELADMFFVSAQLGREVKRVKKEWHTAKYDIRQLIREYDAIKYVDAVIDSNWTKYLPTSQYTDVQATQEAESVQEAYKGRYADVQLRLSPCGTWWVIVGLEAGNLKVLKPSTFRGADDFI